MLTGSFQSTHAVQSLHSGDQNETLLGAVMSSHGSICLWSPIHSLKLSSPDPAGWNLPPSAQHSISEISVNCVWTHMSSPNQPLPTLRLWGEFHLSLYPGVWGSWLTLARKSQLCALFLTPNSVTMKWVMVGVFIQGNRKTLQIRPLFPQNAGC